MVSLRKMVFELYKENNEITLRELTHRFPEANPKTLGNCLSMARRGHKKPSGNNNFTKISLETIEPLVAKSLQKNPSGKALDQAIKILQIKQQDTSLMNEIDLSKFYKLGMNENDDSDT